MNKKEQRPNQLINETSPYLLQHAYNPVNWMPFGKEAFDKAQKENKPLLISIGYSACHWCHVMEHESFEDKEVAAIMNEYFINVKVDREERSDVDMLYMQAVQLMSGHGGWPLNCFVMPDGNAFYGGTYFKKEHWTRVLINLSELYKNDIEKVQKYALELKKGILQSELITTTKSSQTELQRSILQKTIIKWKALLDQEEGGPNRAPKFPLPSNYLFLLRYAVLENDIELLNHVKLTLNKMAAGGIYDQLHGGFARYSTDMQWKVPHFEKMLYDNAQLAALYSEAYLLTQQEYYKETAIDTLQFVSDHWFNEEGYFYSAFDADSDGEEGKYYVWNDADLRELLANDYELFSKYYEINEKGYWEHGNYILMRSQNQAQLLNDFQLSSEALKHKIDACKAILKQEAKSRILPGLDDKCITSWNALMCSAFAKAYLSFENSQYKNMAIQNITFILNRLKTKKGGLYRTYKNQQAKIDGFLEDYAFTIAALIDCYVIDQNENYLLEAKGLTEFCLQHFNNANSHLFYYTADFGEQLAARTSEVADNVIPSSNSQMAHNLFLLGHYFGNSNWIHLSQEMLKGVLDEMQNYGSAYSHWACLALHQTYPFKEVGIVGKAVDEFVKALYQHGLTNTMFALSSQASELALLKNRYHATQTTIYVCENNTCQLPVNSVTEALQQLE